jgi:hypothetical protein
LSAQAKQLLNLLGINVSDIGALVGIDCSPITVVGNAQCSKTSVSCVDNSRGTSLYLVYIVEAHEKFQVDSSLSTASLNVE